MPPRKRWIKVWTQEWITGTTRREMTPDERSVWADFLNLAGDSPDPGKICVYPGIPFTNDQLCKTLAISPQLLERATNKMLTYGKITVNSSIIHIVNWQKYQGEYERVKRWRKHKTETLNETPDETSEDLLQIGVNP